MHYMLGVVTACLLAGCADFPPKPPLPEGEYRPINIRATPGKPDVFNTDSAGVLPALKTATPQLHVTREIE